MSVSICFIALAACHSAPTRLYSLETVSPAAAAVRYTGPPVRIDTVHLPVDMNRDEIITPVALTTNTYQIRELDHWVAPLPELAREVLTTDLIARLPPGKVIVMPLEKPPGAVGVEIGIIRVNTADNGVRFVASWQFKVSRAVVAGPDSAAFDYAAAATTPEQIASRFSDMLAQIADRIAIQLSTLTSIVGPS